LLQKKKKKVLHKLIVNTIYHIKFIFNELEGRDKEITFVGRAMATPDVEGPTMARPSVVGLAVARRALARLAIATRALAERALVIFISYATKRH
jgi:hypothetical protein